MWVLSWNLIFLPQSRNIHVCLILQPNWSQIYSGEKVTLRCEIKEGRRTQWTYEWRTTNRNFPTSSEYRINSATEADSGEYSCRGNREGFSLTPWSNVMNLTVYDYSDPLLLSPVHPVTEGDPVTLSCRDKKKQLLPNVFFYHNDKLLDSGSRGELNISAVSKSDEGFYMCKHSGKDSLQSWIKSVVISISHRLVAAKIFLSHKGACVFS
uniref:Ig-like domain-containing protein n=1 Tax=Poecilia latipinna TaxID=48699 RepID=A0A3B3VLN6_9TELE